jgi:DNA-binding IclR family transcriptional regulator
MSTSGTPRTQSLARAISLLHAIAERPAGSSASELARAADLPRSTAARTLRTLADHGLVEDTNEEGRWVLGYELVRLARAADPHLRLIDTAQSALGRLRDATGESALLAAPRGRTGMEIVLQLDPERHIGLADWVGADVPLHASSAGKLVLAELGAGELDDWLGTTPLVSFTEKTITEPQAVREELARVRRQGWAELVDELEEGLASISAPVRSARGSLAAIVGLSGPTFRLTRSRRRELLPAIRATAAAIELRLPQSA